MLVKGLAALLDVSASTCLVNLFPVPLCHFDGALALHEAVLLLARRFPPSGLGRQRLLHCYRIGVPVIGALFVTNLLLACVAAAGHVGVV